MTKTIVKMMFGSHLYGLNHADSDTDYKGIVLPTKEQILLGKADFQESMTTGDANSKNGAGDIDDTMFSLQKFIRMACQGETAVIDMLHASNDKIIESSDIWDELVQNRHLFYTKNMKAYVGYVRKQAAKYGTKGSRLAVLEDAIKILEIHNTSFNKMDEVGTLDDCVDMLPLGEHSVIITTPTQSLGDQTFYEICGRKFQLSNKLDYVIAQMERIYAGYGARAQAAKDNDGIDWKAISHAMRAGYQLYDIYTKGTFKYPLDQTEYLMKVKMGKIDWLTDAQPELERIVDAVEKVALDSDLPSTVNVKFWNNWISQKHLDIVNSLL